MSPSILESAIHIAPILHDMYDQDVSVYVADTEKIVAAYNNQKLNLGLQTGHLLESQSITHKALTQQKRIQASVELSRSLVGIPYVAICTPLRENDQVVGALTIVISSERYNQLIDAGEEILAAVEEVTSAAENLAAAGEEVAATARDMDSSMDKVKNDVQHVTGITGEIKKVSAQTNILGINASIEAARAGAHGQGFAVVANEVRKLSDSTKTAVLIISEDITNVKTSIEILIESVRHLAKVSEAQAEGVVELKQAMYQISGLAEKLVMMGKVENK